MNRPYEFWILTLIILKGSLKLTGERLKPNLQHDDTVKQTLPLQNWCPFVCSPSSADYLLFADRNLVCLNEVMCSCEVTLISSSAEMPWTQAATVTLDVCQIKGCIEMTKSKALPAIDISFCFQKLRGFIMQHRKSCFLPSLLRSWSKKYLVIVLTSLTS